MVVWGKATEIKKKTHQLSLFVKSVFVSVSCLCGSDDAANCYL